MHGLAEWVSGATKERSVRVQKRFMEMAISPVSEDLPFKVCVLFPDHESYHSHVFDLTETRPLGSPVDRVQAEREVER
jgi:hypothetical protein